jgi:hypothetical protein
VEKWCHIPPKEFQALVESMPRFIEAVLVAQCPIKTLYVGVYFIFPVTCTWSTQCNEMLTSSFNNTTTTIEKVSS